MRFAIDAYDEEIEDSEGLAKDMREHFGVETTPEIMAVAVSAASNAHKRIKLMC